MGYINIIDSGYIKPTNAGTQATSTNMAGNGSKIVLKATEFIPSLSRNIAVEPDIGSNLPSEVNLGSLNNMQFQLRCILNPTTDSVTIGYLYDCVSTNGYKLLWYNYTSANEDNAEQLVYQIALNNKFGHVFTAGEMTKWTLSIAYRHLHVVFNDIQVSHSGDNGAFVYTLTGIVLPVESSSI
jgi:hypothetical protein